MTCQSYIQDFEKGRNGYKGNWFKGLYLLLPPLPPPPIEIVDLDIFTPTKEKTTVIVLAINEEKWGNKTTKTLELKGENIYSKSIILYPFPIWKGRILMYSNKPFDFYFSNCNDPALITNGLNFKPIPCYFYSLSYEAGDTDKNYIEG